MTNLILILILVFAGCATRSDYPNYVMETVKYGVPPEYNCSDIVGCVQSHLIRKGYKTNRRVVNPLGNMTSKNTRHALLEVEKDGKTWILDPEKFK